MRADRVEAAVEPQQRPSVPTINEIGIVRTPLAPARTRQTRAEACPARAAGHTSCDRTRRSPPCQQQPAFAAGWITGKPCACGDSVLRAFTIALCMPSATSCVNSTFTSSKLGKFVSTLAHRIARFPAAGQVAVKERVNAIALAPADEFRRDSGLFGQGVRQPEAQRVIAAALKRGFQTRDPEMDLARLLGDLVFA
jgi:hypothetical protein